MGPFPSRLSSLEASFAGDEMAGNLALKEALHYITPSVDQAELTKASTDRHNLFSGCRFDGVAPPLLSCTRFR